MAVVVAAGGLRYSRCCDHVCVSSKYALYKLNCVRHFSVCFKNCIVKEKNHPNRVGVFTALCRAPILSRLASDDSNKKQPQYNMRKEKPEINSEDNNKKEYDSKSNDLLDTPIVIWPNIFLSIKNFIFEKFIIRPYFDNEFDIKEFVKGAKQALVFVSRNLSSETLDNLEGVVVPEAIHEIRKNYDKLSSKQRQKLLVNLDDIFFCFTYQIGIIMNDESKRRFTEITVVYHCMPGGLRMPKDLQSATLEETIRYVKHRGTICNYRFIKEFTKGVESEWIINKLNHAHAE